MLSAVAEALSEAKGKHLSAHRANPFTALRVTIEGSSTSDTKRKQQKVLEEASEDEALLRLYYG